SQATIFPFRPQPLLRRDGADALGRRQFPLLGSKSYAGGAGACINGCTRGTDEVQAGSLQPQASTPGALTVQQAQVPGGVGVSPAHRTATPARTVDSLFRRGRLRSTA